MGVLPCVNDDLISLLCSVLNELPLRELKLHFFENEDYTGAGLLSLKTAALSKLNLKLSTLDKLVPESLLAILSEVVKH